MESGEWDTVGGVPGNAMVYRKMTKGKEGRREREERDEGRKGKRWKGGVEDDQRWGRKGTDADGK